MLPKGDIYRLLRAVELPLRGHAPLSFQHRRRASLKNQRARSPRVVYNFESLFHSEELNTSLTVFVFLAVRVDIQARAQSRVLVVEDQRFSELREDENACALTTMSRVFV